MNNIFINLGYRDRLDEAFLADNENTIDIPKADIIFKRQKADSNLFNFRYENRSVETIIQMY